MGEIDTKPIEPVQVAVTMFEGKGDHHIKKHRSSSTSSSSCDQETEKEKDVEGLVKELANYKVQMEAKDAAFLQMVHNLEHYQTCSEEFSTLLKNSEVERSAYIEECKEARSQINELESKVKEMADQVSETGKIREQLSHVLSELKVTQGELLSIEIELVAAREDTRKALKQAEMMESEANMEKERANELSNEILELKESFASSKIVAIEAEKEKCRITLEKDLEIELAMQAVAKAQEALERLQRQMKIMPELENQLLAKSVLIDSLQLELNRVNDQLGLSEKSLADTVDNLSEVKAEPKSKAKENSDQAVYIAALETEINQLKQELKDADDEVIRLNRNLKMLVEELERVKKELYELKERNKTEAEYFAEPQNGENITISMKQYKSLMQKPEKANQPPEENSRQELDALKKELKAAMVKIGEFRTRAEQATTRAEVAEKAKIELGDQLAQIKVRKQRRKAALAALREETCTSSNEIISTPAHDSPSGSYQSLGKVLNWKF